MRTILSMKGVDGFPLGSNGEPIGLLDKKQMDAIIDSASDDSSAADSELEDWLVNFSDFFQGIDEPVQGRTGSGRKHTRAKKSPAKKATKAKAKRRDKKTAKKVSTPASKPSGKTPRYSKDSEKKGYNCNKCGLPKKGHVCRFNKIVSTETYEKDMKAQYDKGSADQLAAVRCKLISLGYDPEEMGI